jgi:hypothetical protein
MPLVLADRVRETTTVSGTNDAVLLGAVTGFQSFAVVGNTNTCYYTIADNAGNWEVGIGTYSTIGPTLARTTVLSSSNSGSKVSFPAGTKDIFVTYPSEKSVNLDESGYIDAGGSPNVSLNGNLTFIGTTRRIVGDFSNGTIANRAAFQTSTTNASTNLTVFPNGTGTGGSIAIYLNAADPANSSVGQFRASSATGDVGISSTITGTGTYLPFTIGTGGSERVRIDTSGNVGIGTTAPLGKVNIVGGLGVGAALTGDNAVTPLSNGGIVISGANQASLQTYSSVGSATTVGVLNYYAAIDQGFARFFDIAAIGSTTGAGASIRFLTGSASASERMRITSAGDVGIGTSSPGAKFNVVGTSGTPQFLAGTSANAIALNVFNSGSIYLTSSVTNSTDFTVGTASSIPFIFFTNNTERMRITSVGYVGIGTSGPSGILDVIGTGSAAVGNWAYIKGGNVGASNPSVSAGMAFGTNFSNGNSETNLVWGQTVGAGQYLSISKWTGSSVAEQIRITSTGQVGINGAPTNTLQISEPSALDANIYLTATAASRAAILTLNGTVAGYDWVYSTTNGVQNWRIGGGTTSATLTFGTGSSGTERMRIDSTGRLLVGTTSNVGSSLITASFSSNNGPGLALSDSTIQNGTTFVGFYASTTLIGSVTANGTTAVLYNLTSDARLKTNIVDCPTGNIDDVKVRSFDWKSDGSHVEYGFIAQELVEAAPYAVHQPQNPEEMMAVDYSKLVPMMIKEIQDLKQRIKTLESK